MSPELIELVEAVLRDGLWVPLDGYLAVYKDTKRAVYSRRGAGYWLDGIHAKRVAGAGIWVNLLAVHRWAARGGGQGRPDDLRRPA